MNISSRRDGSMLTLHEDAYYEFFRPYRHPLSHHDVWGGIGIETFGDDMALVMSLPATHLWTVVDGDGDQWILPGIHTVNRICYLITEIPHDWREVEFRIPYRGYSLTHIGLKRQINKLKRFK